MEVLKKDAVYRDLYTVPENMTGEIIDGALYALPRPSPRHSSTASALGTIINGPYQLGLHNGPGGWWILDEPEIHFSDLKEDFMVPDLAGWKKVRLPALPKENYFSVVPDWICEILSPGTATHDRKKKMPKYAQYGVPVFWIIDPANRTVEILKLENHKYTAAEVFGEYDVMRAEPFFEIEIDLKYLWN